MVLLKGNGMEMGSWNKKERREGNCGQRQMNGNGHRNEGKGMARLHVLLPFSLFFSFRILGKLAKNEWKALDGENKKYKISREICKNGMPSFYRPNMPFFRGIRKI
jgi:hypothetical protein